jgi:antitoxin ParD1/3/4
MNMSVERFTISIPSPQFEFIEEYGKLLHKGKSKVIQEALNLLQEKHLEQCYKMANSEINKDFDNSINDGLDDEAW